MVASFQGARVPSPTSTLIDGLRATFNSGRTRPLAWRLQQLEGLARFLDERRDELNAALAEDLGKPLLEAHIADIGHAESEIAYARRRLASWIRPETVRTPLLIQPATSRIERQPLGVVLIIGAWNYPVSLVLNPLVGAIAAGNCAVVKPSEIAAAVSSLLARRLVEYVDPECVAVIEGGVPETTALLEEKFAHIFYTGNGTVGRIVMTAAAKHLTPVTLELGGKSPCLVDARVDIGVAARRILWGKLFNAGQTCVAPDYVLVHEAVHEQMLARLGTVLRDFYGDDPQSSPDLARIVSTRHVDRLVGLLSGQRIVVGGESDRAERYMAPTILRDVDPDSPVMQEEIFGPILPVLRIQDMQEGIAFVNARPKPLALYVFSKDREVQQQVLDNTSSGGVTINHTLLHAGLPGLPFGGVAESGMGGYHGRHSFETFSQRRAVLEKGFAIDPMLQYPPYTESRSRWVRRLW